MLAFALPVGQLSWWAIERAATDLDSRYWGFVGRTLALAGSAAGVVVGASLVLAYLLRQRSTGWVPGSVRVATMGYAVPGTVLAVGILLPLVMLNNALQAGLHALFGENAPAVLLQSTLLSVMLAYLARFLAVGFNPVESGLQRVTRSIDEAAVTLGVSGV